MILSLSLFSSVGFSQSLDIANPAPYEEVDYKKIMEALKIKGYIYYLKHATRQLPPQRQKELVGVHPSELGHQLMASVLKPVIRNLLLEIDEQKL